jgi:N-acetylglucosaminyldiphosphoundecaprenol N-acetyl-beta-D-mannosaminyltransferase
MGYGSTSIALPSESRDMRTEPTRVRGRRNVVGVMIDAISYEEAVATIRRWAAGAESRYVCASNVHSVVAAKRDPQLAASLQNADLILPDGAPIAWLMRRSGQYDQRRVCGPDLMWRYFEVAAHHGESVYLYGSTPETLELLERRVARCFPGLKVVGSYAPPFRPLSADEIREVAEKINSSGAGTVWVSLGCPKQEVWMAELRSSVRAVQIGVGAAFGFHAGTIRRAPKWMQRMALEWLHRLMSEPRRLWRRYLHTNTVFMAAAVRQLLLG